MLHKLAENLWVVNQPLGFFGLNLGARMTVVRFGNGELFLHSPVRLSPDLSAALDALGVVKHVVAPNAFHHLFIKPYFERYPGAIFYHAPGVEKRRKDLTFHVQLGQRAPEAFGGELSQVLFEGNRHFQEVVFCHHASKTLICTDLVFNLRKKTFGDKIWAKLLGLLEAPTVSRTLRLITRNREGAKRSIEAILRWDFDRLVMCHGEVVEQDAKTQFRTAYAWLGV